MIIKNKYNWVMVTTLVHVWVKENFVQEFIDACIKNSKLSVKEPGNLRFDLLQDSTDKTKFVLYEAYESDESAANHKQTEHYNEWRNKVAGWMAKPREGVKHTIIFPTDKSQW